MRIGLFSDTYLPFINGVSASMNTLRKELERQGHQVYIVTVNPDNMKYTYHDRVLRIPGIRVGIFDYRLTSFYPIKAVKRIKSWHLDVIHTQSEFGIGSFGRILSKQLNIPIVHTYHNYYEDQVVYVNRGHFDKLTKKIIKQLTNFLCDKTINELIVPTQKIYNVFREKYKVEREIYVVPTGIPTELFSPYQFKAKEIMEFRSSVGINENDITLLWVGRLGPEKNIDFLIKNHNEIIKKCPNCKLIIVGDGPDRGKLEKMAKENIIFIGKVPYEKMPLYYQLGDILVTASTSETQGLTVNEAMAASLPVVAINDEAFTCSITSGSDGIIFKNKKEYINSICDIILNNKLNDMKQNALKKSESFSAKTFANRILEVYNITLKDKPRGIINKIRRIIGGKNG